MLTVYYHYWSCRIALSLRMWKEIFFTLCSFSKLPWQFFLLLNFSINSSSSTTKPTWIFYHNTLTFHTRLEKVVWIVFPTCELDVAHDILISVRGRVGKVRCNKADQKGCACKGFAGSFSRGRASSWLGVEKRIWSHFLLTGPLWFIECCLLGEKGKRECVFSYIFKKK